MLYHPDLELLSRLILSRVIGALLEEVRQIGTITLFVKKQGMKETKAIILKIRVDF